MAYQDKLVSKDQLIDIISQLKERNQKIVFTNGCFDILHLGHIAYLEEAKALGDFLIIGINSDESINRLKGINRPIQNLEQRQGVIAGLESVDAVISFEEDTPKLLIEALLPDILVKGGDWAMDQIVGSKAVLNNGGKVKSLQFIEGVSTTNIVQKIKNQL